MNCKHGTVITSFSTCSLCESERPKFTQADLDAAILAERERCAAVCRDLYATPSHPALFSHTEGWQDALDLAEQQIRGK